MPSLAEIEADARNCVACPLAASRTNVVFSAGNPASDLMFVGEAPGHDEDLQGEPFVGRSGKLLDRLIAEELGRDRSAYYICNVVKCRPPGNRDPAPGEVEACRHYLDAQVAAVAPGVIVTLGNFATRTLLGTTDTVTRLRGRSYPYGATAIVPTFHPSYALRGGAAIVAEMRADLVRAKRFLPATS
ncbi:MAG TPA: uracil-DNA glycosylase [Acidimicrobiales bacterium]|nr:uracil-DNA glycosylase [Acidimicrobiales bacterium]